MVLATAQCHLNQLTHHQQKNKIMNLLPFAIFHQNTNWNRKKQFSLRLTRNLFFPAPENEIYKQL